MQEMCFKAVEKYLHLLKFVSEHLKTQGMCEEGVHMEPDPLEFILDRFKTVFVTQQQIKSWHDYNGYYWDDDDDDDYDDDKNRFIK